MDYVAVPRLGTIYNLGRAISEVQVISGQLDPELVPKKSIAEHIALCTFEIGSLIGNLCAPWYGVSIPFTIPVHEVETTNITGVVSTFDINPAPVYTLPDGGVDVSPDITGSLPSIWVKGITNPTDQPGIIKIVAIKNDIVDSGTIKKARDISQFWGIAKGRNMQWQKSVVWVQHGNILYIWVGGEIEISLLNQTFQVMAYRGPGALDPSNDNDYMDIPDLHAPLVIKAAALLCMKQSRMGDYQEVEGQVNQGIAQLTAEYDNSMERSLRKAKAEGIET